MKLFQNKPIENIEEDILMVKQLPFYDFVYKTITRFDKAVIVGLYGDYGAGKSSILNLLANEFNKDEINFKFIKFDAWKYEIAGDIAPPLIAKLVAAAKSGDQTIDDSIVDKGKKILKVLAVSGADIFLKTRLDYSVDAIKTAFEFIEEGTWTNEVEKAIKNFEDIIKQLGVDNRKVIIAIDNLDRCLPENAISLLHSIRSFFVSRNLYNLVFVVSAYDYVIKAYIEKLYRDVYIDGGTFLEKIFDYQFKVPLPSFGQYEHLIQIIDCDPFFRESLFKLLNFFKFDKLRNPRKAMLIINKCFMYYEKKNEDEIKKSAEQRKYASLGYNQLLSLTLSIVWNKSIDWLISSNENELRIFFNNLIFTPSDHCQKNRKCKSINKINDEYLSFIDNDLVLLFQELFTTEQNLIDFRKTVLTMRAEGFV